MNNRFTRKCLLLTLASALLILCENGSTADDGLASRRSGIDCILLEKASIVDRYPHHEGYFGLANLGHQIGRGTHIVLAIRAYEESGNIDAQAFWKATLEFATIPELRVQGMNHEVTVLKSYYSDGSSAWVPGGEYTWASNPFTRVQMSRTKNGIEVQR